MMVGAADRHSACDISHQGLAADLSLAGTPFGSLSCIWNIRSSGSDEPQSTFVMIR